MSTRAPLPSATSAAGAQRAEGTDQDTASLEAGSDEAITESLGLLDYGTRARAIPVRLAPHGRYLALGDGTQTRLLRLEDRITHIGRGLTADLRFEDPRVSRTHAILVRHGRTVRLLDNRSANGTFLNGRRVIATNVQNGDVIRFGPVVVQYVEVR